MSTLTEAREAQASDRPSFESGTERDRTRFWISLVVTGLVTAYAVVEAISLLTRHTTGPEIYGVAVAIVAAGTGVLSLSLVASPRRRILASLAVLALWVVIALGGIAGTYAHIVGAPAGEGPVDPRPRPVSAPLIFTALGVVGGAALFYGQHLSATRLRDL